MTAVPTTLEYPLYDLAPKKIRAQNNFSNVQIPSYWKRLLRRNMRCRFQGHDWGVAGYANGHKHRLYEWEAGHYMMCKHCFMRKFELLDTKKQLEDVMKIEKDRWQTHWAKNNSEPGL